MSTKPVQALDEVTVRFAGDSGDGMQLTGSQFTNTVAEAGNDLSTLPDYPSEIRAPAGTVAGVSGFQLHFSSFDIATPGDAPDVLVAMNPAALKVNLPDLKPTAMIIVNTSSFDQKNLKLAGYDLNPLVDGSLKGFTLIQVPMAKLTATALEDINISTKEKDRSKNFFALGLMCWLYSRPIEGILSWMEGKFTKKPEILEGNQKAFMAGYHYGEHNELFSTRYIVEPAKLPPGKYKNISGNEATALGLVAASFKSKLKLFLGSYPITPASDILHELSKYKKFGVKTYQAEDEIAAITAALGASFAGGLAITTTSGPGLALKTEAIGLGVMTELPLVIVNVQRGGPSTGLPTKTEQSDLLQAVYGRNGEAPICVIAAQTPGDCFTMAFEAARIALKYMTPVMLLTDGYLANGSEPWKIPSSSELPDISVPYVQVGEEYSPYSRNEHLSRPWAIPGTPGFEHRIGGLEKSHITGNVNYGPENHEFMVNMRANKIQGIENDIPELDTLGDETGDLLVLGWGGTYGAIAEAVARARKKGLSVSQAHFRYINPMPKNTEKVLRSFKHVIVPELNMGQLASILKSRFLIDIMTMNKVRGLPFRASEIEEKIYQVLGVSNDAN